MRQNGGERYRPPPLQILNIFHVNPLITLQMFVGMLQDYTGPMKKDWTLFLASARNASSFSIRFFLSPQKISHISKGKMPHSEYDL